MYIIFGRHIYSYSQCVYLCGTITLFIYNIIRLHLLLISLHCYYCLFHVLKTLVKNWCFSAKCLIISSGFGIFPQGSIFKTYYFIYLILNSFIEIHFSYENHPFQVYNLIISTNFTKLCIHYYKSVLECFCTFNKISCALCQLISTPTTCQREHFENWWS